MADHGLSNQGKASQDDACGAHEPLLDDFVDGLLDGGTQRRVAQHLDTCDACRGQVESLRRLLDLASDLPGSVEPERDLWPAIEASLGAQGEASAPTAVRTDLWRAPWWQQAAAALLFTVLGAGLGRLGPVPPGSPDIDPDGTPSTSVALAADRDVPGPAAAFAQAEADYLRAKETLWLALYEQRDSVSLVQLRTVERNLAVIDDALRELREALDKDPGNPDLQKLVLANHRRGLDLLWDLARVG